MDNVFEVMVKKKRTFKDIILQFLVLALGIAICITAEYFVKYLGTISLAIIMLTVWFTFKGIMAFNIEYEYTYVNGDIDIDRIFGKNTRRRLSTIVISRIELVAKADNDEIKKLMYKTKTHYVCKDKNSKDNLVIVYTDKDVREVAVIDFNEKVYNSYKKIIPLKVR